MWGYLLAFLAGFFESVKDIFSKKSVKEIDEYWVSFCLIFFAFLFLLPLLFFIKMPALNGKFWLALLASGTLNVLALVLYMKSIKMTDLSLSIPLMAFTPLFLLITSPLILKEYLSFFGFIGVLLIVVGSYVLNLSKKEKGFFAPLEHLVKEKGPRLMLISAFIWSLTSNFDKVGVQNSSPLFWCLAFDLFIVLFLFVIILFRRKGQLSEVSRHWKILIPMGLAVSLTQVTHFIAITLALVPYVISIKRSGILFSVLFGYFIFKENKIKERLLGSAIMIAGIILIVLA